MAMIIVLHMGNQYQVKQENQDWVTGILIAYTAIVRQNANLMIGA